DQPYCPNLRPASRSPLTAERRRIARESSRQMEHRQHCASSDDVSRCCAGTPSFPLPPNEPPSRTSSYVQGGQTRHRPSARAYKTHGISGAKGRNGRPAFDKLCRDATKRQFDVVMAWNVDRLGRSLKGLVAFLSELHALGIDLFLHQQGLDTTTPAV